MYSFLDNLFIKILMGLMQQQEDDCGEETCRVEAACSFLILGCEEPVYMSVIMAFELYKVQ